MADTPKDLRVKLSDLIDQLLSEGGLTTTNINKLGRFTRENPNFMSSTDVQSEMARLQADIASSPQQKALLEGMLRKRKADKVSASVAPFAQAVLGGMDITTALGQIKDARKSAGTLRRPLRPVPLGPSPELNAALSDARGRVNDVDTNVLNALRLQNLDSYMGDLSNARTASGGQAGLYGSLAQGAVNRRNRAALSSVPVLAQLQAQNRARYDNLLAQQSNQNNIRTAQEAGLYGMDLQQFNNESQAVGRLGATGRQNLRNSLYNMGAQVPNLVGLAATQPPVNFNFPRRQTLKDWYETSDYGPRYQPDVYELGDENAPYLQELMRQSEASLYNQQPIWNYKTKIG